jgi:parallel beta-helix repeat protein
MISTTKRRLASLATASAIVATVALAAAPTAAFAHDSGETGLIVDGKNLTAKQIGGAVTGEIDATGFDIAVYFDAEHPGSVDGAIVKNALYYGVVANGVAVDVTDSDIHDIGDSPLNGNQRGSGIYYTGASGSISGNTVSRYQKSGVVAKNSNVTISNNTVIGMGKTTVIAQNGIQVSSGTSALVTGNTIGGNYYTPKDWVSTGLLILDAGGVKVSSNSFFGNEMNMYNGGKGGANIVRS